MRRLPVGLVVATTCLATLTACDLSAASLPLPGGADLGDHPYTVKVEFRDVLDLVPQSSVKVDDVTVGKVVEIELEGYTAVVTVKVRGEVKLPDNAIAEIRQTSLLGEKFVQLAPPASGASGQLADGDVIGLDRSGRNPEVEEVLGALSLVLNGGGVAQLKTIAAEVNRALDGRESDARSVLRQVSTFMQRIDENKAQILTALQRVSSLSKTLNRQEGTIDQALSSLPAALESVDRQRDDLVKMLRALAELSDVGTRVIQSSKQSTIDSLNALAPTLDKLADAGDDFPRSMEIALTYPFVDAIVGRNAQQARDWHMGDYTNLSVRMELDLRGGPHEPPGLPGGLPELCAQTPLDPLCKQLGDPALPGLPLVAAPTSDPVDPDLAAVLTWGMMPR